MFQAFNAIRNAAKTHQACKDANTADAECEKQAKTAFTDSNGVAEMWDKVKAKVKAMSANKRNGGVTKLKRMKSMDIDVEVPVVCSKFDADKMVKDVEAKAKTKDAASKATKEATFAPDGDKTKCAVKIKCAAGTNKTDTEIEANADTVAKASYTVTTKQGRRLLSTAVVYATQGIEEETPAAVPTPTPTPGTLKKTTITHDLTFASLTKWEGDTKAVYEVGYGIGLGLYDESTKKWLADSSVTSKIKSRRGITVVFTATMPNSAASAAEKAAKALTPTTMVDSIKKAKTALNKPNVAAPTAADIKVATPKVTAVVGSASATATASLASLAFVLMALRH